MGAVTSSTYNKLRKFVYRYNVEFRAHKFINKDKLPTSPRHKTFVIPKPSDNPEYLQELRELNEKNKQLDEYLKKVYLTSTDEGKKIESKRPLPTKKNIQAEIAFYEPPQPQPNCLSLSSIIQILFEHQGNPKLNVSDLAEKYNITKESLVNILMYYSLFRKEKFDFMNKDEKNKQEDFRSIELEVNNRLEKRPVRLLEGKK